MPCLGWRCSLCRTPGSAEQSLAWGNSTREKIEFPDLIGDPRLAADHSRDQTGMWTVSSKLTLRLPARPLMSAASQCRPLMSAAGHCRPLMSAAGQCWPLVSAAGQCRPLMSAADQCSCGSVQSAEKLGYVLETDLLTLHNRCWVALTAINRQ